MYSVLIVDDEPFILHGLESIIEWEEYGLEIEGLATNGIKAQEIISAKKIDILLTDIKMPEMDGLDLIEFIRQKNLNIKVIVLSGYDDFNYVKGAIKLGVENYLLKPVNKEELSLTLLNTIKKIESESYKEIYEIKSKDVFKQNLLYRWVSNNISIRELHERASLIGIDLKSGDFMVVTINTLDALSFQKNNLAGNAVYNICSVAITEDISPMIFYDLNNNIIMLFSDNDIIAKKHSILEFLHRCVKDINDLLKINVFTALGSIEHDYQNVYKSYFSSKDLQEYSLIYAPNSILDYYNNKKSAINKHKNINFDLEVLNEHLIYKRKDKAFLLIEDFFNQIFLIDGITPGDIQNISLEILYNISSSYKKAVRNNSIPRDLEILFSDITKIKTSRELIDWIKMILSKTIDYLAFREENENPLIKHIIKYIDTHYQEAISLKAISSMFNVNTSYLGQLFKNETGELFTNYLNEVRIQKAKEMLIQTNLKVYDISYRVGYVNQSLFFRTFKKLTGISPEEFRERALID